MKEEFRLAINLDETTLPKLLKSNAERFGAKKTALREKTLGIWRSYSWQEYYDNVKFFSLGLTSLGLVKGDKVAILGNNRPASLFAELATQAAGAISVALYQDSTVPEVAQVLEQCDVRYVVAEDQEQVDKLLEIKGSLPELAGIIYCDRRGMRHYRRDCLISFPDVQKLGREHDEKEPGLFERRVAEGQGDDTAVICTTSGTTGMPRGALLSHKNLLSMALSLNQVDAKRENDEFVSFLPLAWFGEQMISLASALAVGFTVNFPENPETVMADLREIGPQIMFSPPPVWEGIAASVQVKIMDTTPFKRFMYTTCMGVGQRVAAMRLAGQPVPLSWKILSGFAHLFLFRALRDRLGLTRVRSALTGGSALGSDVFVFFHAIGVNLKQVYGLTELSGISCIHRDADVRGETVGLPLPGTEIRLAPSGEILAKGAGVFQGYYKDELATAAAFEDGWLRTGDAGRLDDNGHLVVIDRLKDVMVLADGSTFAPRFVEAKLKFSPYIREAVVLGSDNSGLTALICLDGRVVGKWAGDNKLSYTTYSDLAARPEVYDFIEKEVTAVNLVLPDAARIERFVLLYKELDADEAELTRTGKVRRGVVAEHFREIIEAMHAGRDEVAIDTTIALQDGKSTRIQTTVPVRKLG
jgi:long-chain acyl-CoA synthetase